MKAQIDIQGKAPVFHSTHTLSTKQLEDIFFLAARGKKNSWKEFREALKDKVISLLFFNPSLRTRASFQAGISRLGGSSVVLSPGADTWAIEFLPHAIMNVNKTEHVKEGAMVLSTYFDAICLRSFSQLESWEEDKQDAVFHAFAEHLSVPLISMESSLFHPCQALADGLTMQEQFGATIRKKTFVLSWTPHPKQLPMAVPNSAIIIASQLGMNVRIACPDGYLLDDNILSLVSARCEEQGSTFEVHQQQEPAFSDADVIYAKSWTPPQLIGKCAEEMSLRISLGSWTIDAQKMALTNQAHFMHCLPIRRNVEATDEVIDSPRSLIQQQVENRLHVQNALLVKMLTENSNHV